VDVNPAAFGNRQWRLAATYGFGQALDATQQQLQTKLDNLNTEEVARRLVAATKDTGLAQANVAGLNTAIIAINMTPGGATADAIDRKDYVDAVISLLGDVATVGAFRAARQAGRALKAGLSATQANQALVRFQAIDGVVALARVGQSGYAVLQGEDSKAAGYTGDALLRIFGIAYTRAVPRKRGPAALQKVDADLLQPRLGPAQLSHPAEYAQIITELKGAGVTIEKRPGSLGYSPTKGGPGKMVLDPDASIGALRHEYQHFLDVQAAEFPGLGAYFNDLPEYARLEVRGYLREIYTARQTGHADLVPKIVQQMKARVKEVLGK
jgi:hypothetical protein